MDDREYTPLPLTTQELANQVNEKCEGKEPGSFYRYMTADTLRAINEKGQIGFDGKAAFNQIVTSEKFNPAKLPGPNMLAYYFLDAIDDYLIEIPDWKRPLYLKLLKGDSDSLVTELELIEKTLVANDPQFEGLKAAYDTAIADSDTASCMEYFKRIGGEQAMIHLERSGWDINPNGAFSELMPISVGAPLYLSGGDKIVIVEMNFSRDEIVVPDNDDNNEHEVMVRQISMGNITRVYTQESQSQLLDRLQNNYPEYFKHKLATELSDFARGKPLSELLQEA